MSDFWVKITEREEENLQRHHYLVTANTAEDARRIALKFIRHFSDVDDEPEEIENGYAFCNRAVFVQIADVKETTKDEFKDFLLKMHTIDWK